METKTYTTIDRIAAGWPSGPWDNEPDKVQWPDAKTGLPCLAVRHSRSGHWCGYVGVAENHPWYGKDYFDVDDKVSVHGGLTFSAGCEPNKDESRGICHVPTSGEPDHVWWFGFDCHHSCDRAPGEDLRYSALFTAPDSVYRTLRYVKSECESMALQIFKVNTADLGGNDERL